MWDNEGMAALGGVRGEVMVLCALLGKFSLSFDRKIQISGPETGSGLSSVEPAPILIHVRCICVKRTGFVRRLDCRDAGVIVRQRLIESVPSIEL